MDPEYWRGKGVVVHRGVFLYSVYGEVVAPLLPLAFVLLLVVVEILITETVSERTVSAAVGDVLTIKLPENPSTGFRWHVASVDAGALALQADDFLQRASAAVGGGGVRIFRFLAVNPGSTDIRLELQRTWEALPPTSAFTTRVLVK